MLRFGSPPFSGPIGSFPILGGSIAMKLSPLSPARIGAALLAIFALSFTSLAALAKDNPTALDLNKATSAQLQEIPGVGEATAKKIIDGRPYKSVDDLSKAGVPASTISKIRSRVTVSAEKTSTKSDKASSDKTSDKSSDKSSKKGDKSTSSDKATASDKSSTKSDKTAATEKPSTKSEKSTAKDTKSTTADSKTAAADTKPAAVVDLNKATEAQLQEIPGIGESYAKKIVKGRPYKSVDDLAKAGIPSSTITKIRTNVTVGGETFATASKATTPSKTAMPKVESGLVNLNTATEQQIEELSGIGPTYARKIIAKRPYKSIDDLSRAGIPTATITKIRPMVTVASSPSPQTVAKPVTPEPKATSSDSKTPTPDKSPKLVDLNKATEAELQEISGVGEAYSKKIIEGRPYKSIDDLSKAGIPAATIDKIKPQVTVGGAIAPPAKGMVWVNLETKLYHKEGSRWYGNTKSGKYMTEAEAEKAGYKASKQ